MVYSVPSHSRANGTVDVLKVGVRSFDEPEEVCEKWDRIAVNSLDLIGSVKTSF